MNKPAVDYQVKMAHNHITAFLKVTNPEFEPLYNRVKPLSMLPVERLYDLFQATRYVDQAGVDGDIVEVGVWRGGALGIAALASGPDRTCVGFDTFSGHVEPQADELDVWGNSMQERWRAETESGERPWADATAAEVRSGLDAIGVDPAKIELIEGDVQETAPLWGNRPISILRIDCDWYPESLATLESLYPHLSQGGVLICDDYGHHSGQRRAVDEYFEAQPIRLSHVDYSCVVATRLDSPGAC